MGKLENDEFSLSSTAAAEAASIIEANNNNNNNRREDRGCFCNFWFNFNRFINFKCIFALLLGISVFISAIFWLPPIFNFTDFGDNDLDPRYRGHTIVASFKLQKPTSFVKDNTLQLEADIYNELTSANAKVVILSLEDSGLNSTDVVFGIDSLSKRSKISIPQLSLIRSNFVSFVTGDMKLRLTTSLFGEPSIFELLKFPGGITITPHQNVYPLQALQISFNFTLNNSILQIQDNFDALGEQLMYGLHLAKQEILYIRLTNCRGSTVAPPTTVQTSVVLTVGVPSVPRMKQLAKTIKDSPARNLGLNNTVFGKVKQVSLSSILPAGGSSSPTSAPTPGPIPHFPHHHHHRDIAPSQPPTRTPQPVKGSPAPWRSYQENPYGAPAPYESRHASPPGVRTRSKGRHSSKSPGHSPTPVAVAPRMSDHHRSAPSPHRLAKPPSPVGIYAPAPSDKTPQVSPLISSGDHIMAAHWILSLSIALLLHPL